jgi:hypothetical protein
MRAEEEVSNASDQNRSRGCWYPGRNNEFRAARLKRVLIGDLKRSFALKWPAMCFDLILVAGVIYALNLPSPEAKPTVVQPKPSMAAKTVNGVKPVSLHEAR